MHVEHVITINASVDRVWAVTVDVERWPEWTPTVTHVERRDEGPFGLGSVARIRQPGQPLAAWTVTAFEPGVRFTWETRRKGLRMAGTHELAAAGAGTRNRLRIEATGPMAVLLWPVLRIAVPRALVRENRGLKARCEGAADPRRGEA